MKNPIFKRFRIIPSSKKADPNKTLDDVDPELLAMYKKLGISIDETEKDEQCGDGYCGRFGIGGNNFQKTLNEKKWDYFCSISEANQRTS